ncbi:hypothetical protein [Mycolicibacterium sp.]|uniref:hypothetical protein n=1 Tax=Mycolicibacterium sp. TaxID=2320850 RepID=UPI003D0CB1A7
MTHTTTALLDEVLDAHGGLAVWRRVRDLHGRIDSSGVLFETKGRAPNQPIREFTVAMREVAAQVRVIGEPLRVNFTAERTTLVSDDGSVLAEQTQIRDGFAGHELSTPWNPLQGAYFSGYALWNYFNLPFLLTLPGVRLTDIEPVEVDGQTLVGIGAELPDTLPTHSRSQRFYFGPDRLLRRHDYRVDIAGSFPINQYVSDYVTVGGLAMPTTRRAYLAEDHEQVPRGALMVALNFSELGWS